MRILVTGADGYVGGRLVPRLLDGGHRVRVLAPRGVDRFPWADRVEVVRGLDGGLRGVQVVYHLARPASREKTAERDELRMAQALAGAARAAKVKRIVHLGELHPESDPDSWPPQLRAHADAAELLIGSGVPTASLQPGLIIGGGSAALELVRQLLGVLAFLPAPRWMRNRMQPIAIDDLLHYLVLCLKLPKQANRTFDVGGPDVLRVGQLLNGFAVEAGLPQRRIAPVPVTARRLTARWAEAIGGIPGSLAEPLVAALQQDGICRENAIRIFLPDPPDGPTTYRAAVRAALDEEAADAVPTTWRDDVPSTARRTRWRRALWRPGLWRRPSRSSPARQDESSPPRQGESSPPRQGEG